MPTSNPLLARAARVRPRTWLALGLGVAALALVAMLAPPVTREPLKELYTPRFRATPELLPVSEAASRLQQKLGTPEGERFLQTLSPNQAGVLWLTVLVVMVVGIDFSNLRNPRNVDLAIATTIPFLFFDILRLGYLTSDSTWFTLLDWVYIGITSLTCILLVRAVVHTVRPLTVPWRPNLTRHALAALALTLLVADVGLGLVRPPDDAGWYINIGAQRLRERGHFPYGDPLLTQTPAAAYGPVLYLAHLPFQKLLAPEPVNADSPARPTLGVESQYYLPPVLATKLCTISFHLLAAFALLAIGRRYGGDDTGYALVALYCGAGCVLGIGGDIYSVGGITFVSHIAPAAVTLAAFAALDRPALAGVLMAAAIGVLFYPGFMVPAWAGFYWRDRSKLIRFIAGLAVTSALLWGSVVALSRSTPDHGVLGTIFNDTLGHQESPQAYGLSPFGFWGQRTGIRALLMHPLVGQQAMTRPVVLAYLAFVVGAFWLARRTSVSQFAFLLAALAIGCQLWKIHATATYMTWYYPLLLVGLLTAGSQAFVDGTPAPRTRFA